MSVSQAIRLRLATLDQLLVEQTFYQWMVDVKRGELDHVPPYFYNAVQAFLNPPHTSSIVVCQSCGHMQNTNNPQKQCTKCGRPAWVYSRTEQTKGQNDAPTAIPNQTGEDGRESQDQTDRIDRRRDHADASVRDRKKRVVPAKRRGGRKDARDGRARKSRK